MEKWRKVVRLYAFSLLAHRQWGTVPDGQWEFYFPIAFSSNISYGIGTTRSSGIGCFSFILRVKAADHIKWTDADINGAQGQGDSYSFILIGY